MKVRVVMSALWRGMVMCVFYRGGQFGAAQRRAGINPFSQSIFAVTASREKQTNGKRQKEEVATGGVHPNLTMAMIILASCRSHLLRIGV